MIDQIKTRLENEIITPSKVDEFNRNHIFYDIKNIVIKNSNTESIVDLYYCFSLYEKCLSLARGNNMDLAAYWLHKVEQAHSNLSKELLEYLQILYIPCLAFYHYKKENYDIAMDLLSTEIRHSDLLLKNNQALKVEMKLEQLINKYRIYVALKDYESSVSLAVAMINFVTGNKKFDEIGEDDINWVADENYDNYLNWVNFLVNNIISKIEHDKEISENEKTMIYYAIFSNAQNLHCNDFIELIDSFNAYKYHYEGNHEAFLEHISKAFKKIHTLPVNLQRILLKCLTKSGYIDSQLNDEYMTKILKIKLPVYQ
ncbi:hypothetical protein IX39_19750 [Chryseobacterium formosense]|uniref:Uncharacterized protein n=1 Tax=Chryseobacterium formosense TaxID=236814 RepID=A0A085YZA3_9FLAO|nr:hypothetical protein [Chryseobacterium formosense]KFE97516.1 hypothetical protein IX39_19750 [Chryseobacterium formosense]SFT75405.1 hypothetical protein SAMN05421857_3042 [Chryseobacterium formosense]